MSRMAMGISGRADLDEGANKLRSALHEVFTKIDEDKGGTLDKGELGHAFDTIGCVLKPAELDAVMRDMDNSGGGEVGFENFCGWMLSMHPKAKLLRHSLASNVLGGKLEEFITEDELEAIEAKKRVGSGTLYVATGDPGQTIFILLEEPESSTVAKLTSVYMQLLIFGSSVIFITESLPSVRADKELLNTFHVLEWICILHFTAEYCLRLATCTRRPYSDQRLWSYVKQPMNVIDVFAILPAYIEWLIGRGSGSLAVLRILRLARIFRVLKVPSAAKNLALVAKGMQQSKTGLILLVYLVCIFMVVMSSVMYMIEGPAVLGSASAFPDIPSTFWFTIVTMTSVGYGDIYPATSIGHFVGCIIMLSGILTLAVPITLIGNKFHTVWIEEKQKERKQKMMLDMQLQGDHQEGTDGDVVSARVVPQSALNTRIRTAVLLLQHSWRATKDPRFQEACEILLNDAADLPDEGDEPATASAELGDQRQRGVDERGEVTTM